MNLHHVFQRLILREAGKRCPPASTGRPRGIDDSTALDIMFMVLRTGMQWREVRSHVAPTTILRKMHVWRDAGVFEEAYRRMLHTHKKLNSTRYYAVDSCYVKNAQSSECVGRNHTDRGRHALKLSVIVDHTGVPWGACCHPGNRPDVTLLAETLESRLIELDKVCLYADRGYDSRRNRRVCQDAGVKDRIFRRRQKTTRRTNARRIVVEHTFAWAKRFRRLLYMYETSSAQFLTFVYLAFGHLACSRFASE